MPKQEKKVDELYYTNFSDQSQKAREEKVMNVLCQGAENEIRVVAPFFVADEILFRHCTEGAAIVTLEKFEDGIRDLIEMHGFTVVLTMPEDVFPK